MLPDNEDKLSKELEELLKDFPSPPAAAEEPASEGLECDPENGICYCGNRERILKALSILEGYPEVVMVQAQRLSVLIAATKALVEEAFPEGSHA